MNRLDGKPRRSWIKPNESYDDGDFTFVKVNRKGNSIYYKIDSNDKNKVLSHHWCYQVGYAYNTGLNKKNRILLHHLIMGFPKKGFVVDHIDRDKTNNSKTNLRFVTQKENILNSGRFTHSIKKYNNLPKGVSEYSKKYVDGRKLKKKFRAYITLNSRHIWMKNFYSVEEALLARREKELEIYGKYKD